MSRSDHWANLIWLLCLALVQQEAASYCGSPREHGGQHVQAYLDNKSDKLVLPWTVAIRNKYGRFKCLGSIIPDNHVSGQPRNFSRLVLTAGSCFRHALSKRWGTPHHYKVYAGVDRLRLMLNGGQDAVPHRVRIMPVNAGNENIWNGVALVMLKKPFIYTKNVSPVCIARPYAVPSETSVCFVSTYHKGSLDEDIVRMAPGSVCRFGQFPEMARVKGLCSLDARSDKEKSLGGPLVCMVDGRAYQFGVYLSQLVTTAALPSHKQVLHYYGHVTPVLETNPQTVSSIIILGWKKRRSPERKGSSSSPEQSQGCFSLWSCSGTGGPGKPAAPPRARPAEPEKPFVPFERRPVYCGDTITFGRTVQSFVVGNNAQDMFPWNIIVASRVRGSTKCIGSLVHRGDHRHVVNGSDIVLTAADCFSRYKAASAISRLRVYASSPRFSRFGRRGTKVKMAQVSLYGLLWGNNQMRRGIAIVKLERPLVRKDNVVPVCLAPKEAVPPPAASCYVTHYSKAEHRMDEEIVLITRNARCLAAGSSTSAYRGICAIETRKKHYIQRGSPLVCLVDGRAYQYGVYLNELSLSINDKVKQNLGFYSEMGIAHDVFAGRKIVPLPDNIAHQTGTKPSKPVQESSSSSSVSREHRGSLLSRIPDIYLSIPTLPPLSAGLELGRSKSSSSSSAPSSDKDNASPEHTSAASSSEGSDERTRMLRLKVKVAKSKLSSWLGGRGARPTPRPSSQPPKPAPCPAAGQRPTRPMPGPASSSAVVVCPMPGKKAPHIVPLPTPLPTAEYPSSSLETVSMVIEPLSVKYDLSSRTITEHEHIKVQDTIVEQTAIAKGASANCNILGIGNELNSLPPRRSSGQLIGNSIDNVVPSVTGAMIKGPCTAGSSGGHRQSVDLPGASAVHIFAVSGSSLEALCSGTLYVRRGEQYSDEVITASRCVPPKGNRRYKVYIGSLLPRRMTVNQPERTLIEVGSLYATPFYKGYDELKEIGMTVLKLKHRVKVTNGVQSFPLPYPSTGASSRMDCYVSGVCKHGMPVRTEYRLLEQMDCKRHLGDKFLPNVMYCGVGQTAAALQYRTGAPLICQSAGRWVQFGIYDHTFPIARSNHTSRDANAIVPDDIALFIRLEGEGAAEVQDYPTKEISYV